jgi:Tfp pilus assembly protein PilZ
MEKRQSQRSDFTEFLKLKLSATHPSADFLVRTARGIDISTGGVGLETDDELQKGEVVKLSVPLGMGGTNIPVFAEVRWVKPLNGNYRMGLQFLA